VRCAQRLQVRKISVSPCHRSEVDPFGRRGFRVGRLVADVERTLRRHAAALQHLPEMRALAEDGHAAGKVTYRRARLRTEHGGDVVARIRADNAHLNACEGEIDHQFGRSGESGNGAAPFAHAGNEVLGDARQLAGRQADPAHHLARMQPPQRLHFPRGEGAKTVALGELVEHADQER
jgi:hypothetical protein